MKKRMIYVAWFVVLALACVAFVGMGLSGMGLSFRHKAIAVCAGVGAVCALIGVFAPDKMKGLFFGKNDPKLPGK